MLWRLGIEVPALRFDGSSRDGETDAAALLGTLAAYEWIENAA
jgi:hypothetical protein